MSDSPAESESRDELEIDDGPWTEDEMNLLAAVGADLPAGDGFDKWDEAEGPLPAR